MDGRKGKQSGLVLKLKPKTINIATLSNNARKHSNLYPSELLITSPHLYRKEGTYVSR